MNKKGFSFIDTLAAILLTSFLILTLYGFESYYLSTSSKLKDEYTYHKTVHNQIQKLYSEDWNEHIVLTIDGVELKASHYEEITVYGTEKLIVTFKQGDMVYSYTLERYKGGSVL